MKFNGCVILKISDKFITWNTLIFYLLVVGIGPAATSPLHQIVCAYPVSGAVPVDQTEIFSVELISNKLYPVENR